MDNCITAAHQEMSLLNFDWAYGVGPILVVLALAWLVRRFQSPYVIRDAKTKKRVR